VERREPAGRTPFEVIAAERPTASATKSLLLPMSHHLENRALRIGEGALVAQDLGDTGRERDRRFVFTTAHDRGLVIAAARTLLALIAPVSLPHGALIR